MHEKIHHDHHYKQQRKKNIGVPEI